MRQGQTDRDDDGGFRLGVSKGGSFCRQFCGTLKLLLLQRMRAPITSIVEFIIPILFIIGSVILYVLIKDTDGPGGDYSSYQDGLMVTRMRDQMLSVLCFNDTVSGLSIDGLVPCSLHANASSVMCFGKKDGLPLNDICISLRGNPNLLMGQMFAVIQGYTNSMVPIPNFDEMVKMQWVAKCIMALKSARPIGTLAYSGFLYLVPEERFSTSFVAHMNATTSLFKYVFDGYFASMQEATNFLINDENEEGHWGVINVEQVSMNPASPLLNVSIWVNASAIPRTAKKIDAFYAGGLTSNNADYLLSGFLTLQNAVYRHYMTNALDISQLPEVPFVVPMPTASYVAHTFLSTAGLFVPLMVVLGFLFPVSQSTKRIVLDKELRLKEALLIMGLRQSVQYITWFAVAVVQYALVSVIIAIILKVTYMKQSNFGVLFFLFFLFAISSVALSGFIASFFSKARLSSMLAPLVYFILSTPLFAIQSAGAKVAMGLCILSPTAFAQGLSLLFNYEAVVGFQSKDILTRHDQPNMLFIFIMLLVDTALYIVLTLYFDAVIQNDWGTPRNTFFCIIDPIMWCFRRKKRWESDEDGRNKEGAFEPLTEEGLRKSAVTINGLTKVFKRGGKEFVAVDHLHWSLVEGEMSVLLGHNGAGKTTTINMMTGMVKPDGGDCHIYGHSIRTNLVAARQEIGFCPQHNILWPDLTCYEHLSYFSSIKGLSGKQQESAINFMLNGVDLEDKRDCASSTLSGGQKRKLSVAIAFVGGSRLIFLDEPTAGMDVGARRHTWKVLRQMTAGRTFLLSTHFMDEADLLGDCIAIMNKGRMQCAGSSVFLKSNLGVGYNITMSVSATADRRAITSLIRSHVPPAEVLCGGAGELSFRLPIAFVKGFSRMLSQIEDRSVAYGVQNYTLSATTLEEIFLHIANEDTFPNAPHNTVTNENLGVYGVVESPEEREEHSDSEVIDIPNPLAQEEESCSPIENTRVDLRSVWGAELMTSESAIVSSQLRVTLMKRILNALRDRRTQCIQIVFPVIMVVFAMLLNMVNFTPRDPLTLSSNMYGEHVRIDGGNCAQLMAADIPFARDASFYDFPKLVDSTNFSAYLASTYHDHSEERYGGFVCNDPNVNASAIFFNVSAPHAVGVGVVGYYGAVVQNALSTSVDYLEDIFITVNNPLPRTRREEAFKNTMKALLVAMLTMIPFSFVPSTFVGWIVKERECKARHLQNVSGLRFSIYWISNYIFDFCSYLVTMFLVIIMFLIFHRSEYVSDSSIGPTILLFAAYGASCIAMSYAVSFIFNEHSTAQNVVMLVNFITGFLLVLLVTVLQILPSTQSVSNGLRWAFRIVPSYCVGEGIVNLASLDGRKTFGATPSSAWGMNVVVWPIVYMIVEMPLFFLMTLFIDHPTRRMRTEMLLIRADDKPESIPDEDEDVVEERERVLEQRKNKGVYRGDEDLVQVTNLRKIYGNGKVAVRNVTFGVKPGEVFGFLGTNGAGKTTTISILCQEMVPTSGHGSICGKDIVKESREALRCIGYCPQFDALLDLLTVEEHLKLYAGIRGIVHDQRTEVIRELMELCELTEYKKSRAGALSGGNKRKLSVALALIGGPRVVFLDEPSAGMDPVARRVLWTAIQSISGNCSVVLTTHHLEEVEALAHRVAIMVDGTLRCIGNKTHLKKKYGSGIEMTLRAKEGVSHEQITDFVKRVFPDAVCNEVRGQRYTYALPSSTSLPLAFGQLEENREAIGIADYSVSQTSIEQVFLRISEAAEAEANGYQDAVEPIVYEE